MTDLLLPRGVEYNGHITTDVVKVTNFSEIGMTGLVRDAGYVQEELLPSLQGRKAILAYKDMQDNDPTVGSILFAIDMLLRQVDWYVEPPESDHQDTNKDKLFVEECLDDMSHSWKDAVSEILTMLPFGWSFHEIVYKRRRGNNTDSSMKSKFNDGKVGWRKFPIRAQEALDHWEFDSNGGIVGLIQNPAPLYDFRLIPMEKGLLFRTTTRKNNPEGRSVLRNAYRPWYYKNRMENVEGVGVERDLAGIPVAEVDPGILSKEADAEQVALRNAIRDIVQNLRRDKQEGVLWPSVYDEHGNQLYNLKLLNSGGSRQFDTTQIINRYDQRIAMTVLGDFILLGHEAVGSFALSSSKTNLFAVALGTWLDVIADVMNRFAIPRLFEANNMPTDDLPKLAHRDVETPNLAELAQYIQALSISGVPLFPDEKLEQHVRQVAHLPEKSEDANPLSRIEIQAQAVEARSGGGGGEQGSKGLNAGGTAGGVSGGAGAAASPRKAGSDQNITEAP